MSSAAQAKDRVDRARLIAMRRARDLAPVTVARKVGISRSRYCNYERGTRAFPSGLLADVAAVLGCSVDSLLLSSDLPERENLLA